MSYDEGGTLPADEALERNSKLTAEQVERSIVYLREKYGVANPNRTQR